MDYRSVCSNATLQSDKLGFFLHIAETIEEVAGEKWVSMFRDFPSHSARISACLTDLRVSSLVEGFLSRVQEIYRGKAGKFARNKLDEGKHWLQKGNLTKALASTNLAVVRAPLGGKDEEHIGALSVWLRSEIFYKLFEYKLSLSDVQLALSLHLPAHLKAEAYRRMGVCYLNLGNEKKAKVALSVAQSCGDAELVEECSKILTDIKKYLKNEPMKKEQEELCNSVELPGISSSLEVFQDNSCGRYFRAVQDISIGEWVAIEEPYVSALFLEKHGTHCLHCYSRLKAPVPCPKCSGVAFCSKKCQTEGLKYHKWECPYLELIIGSGMSALSYLSLRIITQENLEYFKQLPTTNCPYKQLLSLESHLNEREGKDLLRRTLMALFLLQILRHGGYFKTQGQEKENNGHSSKDNIGELTNDELEVASLLLNHLLVLEYNSHEIYETLIAESKLWKTNYIGLALYLSSSLFNHQCQPTVARYFNGRKIVLRAQHPINTGDEVSENYGPVFTMRTKDQRQKLLSGRYLFECKCEACLFDWPRLEDMDQTTVFFRCRQEKCSGKGFLLKNGVCNICKKKASIGEDRHLYTSYQKDWEKASDFLKDRNYSQAEKLLIDYVQKMWKLVHQPNKNLCLAMEGLRTIWANASGNVSLLPS